MLTLVLWQRVKKAIKILKCRFFVFVDAISCTSIKFAFKIITVAVEVKRYSNIKVIADDKI